MRRILCISALLCAVLPRTGLAQYRNAFNIRFQNLRFDNPTFNGFAFQSLSPTSPRPTEIRFGSIQFQGLDSVLATPAVEARSSYIETGFRSSSPAKRNPTQPSAGGLRWRRREERFRKSDTGTTRRGMRRPFGQPVYYGAPPSPSFDRDRQIRRPFAGGIVQPASPRVR